MDVNAKDSMHHSALYYAVCSNDREGVKRLLDEGADVNAKIDVGRTCLVMAAMIQADVAIIRLLVSAPGVDVNAKDSAGNSALLYAVFFNNLDAVKVLLEHGAQLDYHRCSELWIAARKGNNEMVKLLLPYAAKQQSPENLVENEFFEVVLDGSADVMRYYLCHDRSLANVYFDDKRVLASGFNPNIYFQLPATPAHLQSSTSQRLFKAEIAARNKCGF